MTLEQLREVLSALRGDNPASVTDEQLAAARAAIRELAAGETDLQTLRELSTGLTAITTTRAAREQESAERAGLLAELTEPDPEPAAAPEQPAAQEPAQPPVVEPVPAPTPAGNVAPAPVTAPPAPASSPDPVTPAPLAVAAAGTPAPLGSIGTPPDQQRAPAPLAIVASTTANGGIPSFSAGQSIGSLTDLGRAIAERLRSVGGSRAAEGERLPVARTTFTYPEERRLDNDASFETNWRKMDAAATQQGEALVAAGGLCAPPQTLYDIDVIGSSARPIRDQALVRFAAERGAITYRPNASAAEAVNGAGVWTMADDEAAVIGSTDPRKTCYEVPCPGLTEAVVQTIYECLEFSNITSRFDPETTASNVRQGVIAHTRLAENELLRQIMATSKVLTAGAQEVGAVRHALVEMDKIVAYYQQRHRIDEATSLTWLIPRWVRSLFRADLAYQMAAGDWTQALAASDALINGWFRARGITPVWHLDGQIGGTPEVQTITVTGTPTGGTYTLTYSGQTTTAIPYNATAAQVKTALEALSNIGYGDLSTGGGPHPGTAITVTWTGYEPGFDAPLMTATGSFTGGTTPAVAVATTTAPSTTTTVSAVSIPSQVYALAAAGAEVPEFPAKIDSALYVTGTKLFLDGGTLDLGIVRDSELNSRNRYRQFFETFEGVADRGIESLRVVIPAVPAGMSAGTVDMFAA